MTNRTTDDQERDLSLTDERWEELRGRYEAAQEKHERALRRMKRLQRRHQRIRQASGWRRVLRVLLLP